MNQELSKKQLQEIENQLSHPSGIQGIEMADMMNETNIEMTLQTIKALNISHNKSVLELGHGNCGHLPEILKQADNISYTGLEISETMQQEAMRKNKDYLSEYSIEFKLY